MGSFKWAKKRFDKVPFQLCGTRRAILTSFHWLYAGAGAGAVVLSSPVEKLDCLPPLCHPLRGPSDHPPAAGAPDSVNQLPKNGKPKLKAAVAG